RARYPAGSGQPVRLELPIQCAWRDPEYLRSLALVPARLLEHRQDLFSFELVKARRTAVVLVIVCLGHRRTMSSQFKRQVFGLDHRIAREYHRALDHVPQLANISRPAIIHQHLKRFLAQHGAVVAGSRRKKMNRERRDIVGPLSKRWKLYSEVV